MVTPSAWNVSRVTVRLGMNGHVQLLMTTAAMMSASTTQMKSVQGAHFGIMRHGPPHLAGWLRSLSCSEDANGPARDAVASRHSSWPSIWSTQDGRDVSARPLCDRVRYEEAADDLRAHYKTTGSRNVTEAEWRLKHLGRRHFCARRISGIGPADATTYALARQEAGASNGTINRELAVLIRMLRLAYENGKLLRMPIIRKLKEGGPRQGFSRRSSTWR